MIDIIHERLQQHFSPTLLEVQDDSARHQGHAGSANGAGHYTVIIRALCFENQSRLEVHRAIYQVLSDLIPDKIHALSIVCT